MAQPMYHRIADDLKDKIESGALPRSAQLPTELELREQYDASRNTIRDAIKRLTSLGLVETRPGQGTFVVQEIHPFITTLTSTPASGLVASESSAYRSDVSRQRRSPKVSTPRVEIQAAGIEITSRLGFEPGTQVVSRHQQRFIDDIPWSLQTSYYPMTFVTSGKAPELLMAEDMPDGVVPYLEQKIGFRQVGFRDWITARTPDSNEQIFFKIPHDATVFEIFRASYEETGNPVRVTVTVFPADRNQFLVEVGTLPPLQNIHPAENQPGTTTASP